MRTDPEISEVVNGERGMVRGISTCLEQQCLVSAVTLIYSAIDSLAALARPVGQADTTKTEFLSWVDQFLLPSTGLACTAKDIYGARCGVLHTYSPDSATRRKGAAKALVYYWRSGPAADAEVPLPKDTIVIAIEDLFSAFKNAVDKFFKEISSDDNLWQRVEYNRKELLCYKPFEVVTIHVAT